MKKTVKRMAALAMAGLMAFSAAGCSKSSNNSIEGQRVRFIIGAGSTSGDTYLAANVAVNYLNNKLDLKGKLIQLDRPTLSRKLLQLNLKIIIL